MVFLHVTLKIKILLRLKFSFLHIYFLSFVTLIQAQNAYKVNELNVLFETSIYNNLESAQKLAFKAVQDSEFLKDETLLLESYTNLSLVYYRQKQNDSSFIYTQNALDLSHSLQDFKKQAILYNQMGALEKRAGNYSVALKHYQKALEIAKTKNYVEQLCDICNNLASLYRIRGDEVKFLDELQKSINLSKENNLKNNLATSYNIKGISLFEKQKDSSIYYYKEAISLFRASGHRHFEGLVYANLGDVYINIGDYDKALEALEISEIIAKEVNNMTSLYFINLSLGIYNIEIENYDNCVLKYEKAINEYGKYIDNSKLVHGYWLLTEGYYLNGQYKEAYDAQEKYIELNESLLNAEKAKEFDEIRTEFEVEKKDTQIVLLEKENELAEARKNEILIIGLLLTITFSSLLLYYRNRIKTQKNIIEKEREHSIKEQEIVQVKALIEGQDKERHRIAKELHDGLGGQLAGVNLKLSQVNSELRNPDINFVSQKISNIFNDLRILSHSLSSTYFNDKKFDELLVDLKHQYQSTHEFKICMSIFPEESLNDLNAEVKHNLYRILQELFNNVLKHSNSNNVELSFNRHNDLLIVIFEDDGVGFNTTMLKQGIGLNNINERSKSINASLVIDSLQGKGTQITLQIPIC